MYPPGLTDMRAPLLLGDCPAWSRSRLERARALIDVQPFGRAQSEAQVGGGEHRSLARDTDGATAGEREQCVVGSLAVEVDPQRRLFRVGLGDQCGSAVEHGDGVEPLGHQFEPLLRDWVDEQHALQEGSPSSTDRILAAVGK